MKKLLRSRRGDVTVQTVAVIMILILMIIPVYHYCRILYICNSVKSSFRDELVKTVTANYHPSYDGMREGNSGAYNLESNVWTDKLNKGSVISDLTNKLSLNQNGTLYDKTDPNGALEYTISNINITVQNAELADNSNKLSAKATYTITVPIKLLNNTINQSYNINTDAEFEPTF